MRKITIRGFVQKLVWDSRVELERGNYRFQCLIPRMNGTNPESIEIPGNEIASVSVSTFEWKINNSQKLVVIPFINVIALKNIKSGKIIRIKSE